MKKYKLIKWYPGLPFQWKNEEIIATIKGEEIIATIKGEDVSFYHYFNRYICIKEIEQNPEFWENINDDTDINKKIRNIGYQILSFIDSRNYLYNYDKMKDMFIGIDKYKNENEFSLYSMLFENVCVVNYPDRIKIHSIKRLSDNTIFTIGDQIFDIYSQKVTIQKFEFFIDGDLSIIHNFGACLFTNNLVKVVEEKIPIVEEKIPVLLTKEQIEKLEKMLK